MGDNNPLDQLGVLMTRLGEIAQELGLDLQGFAVIPNPEPGGPHMCQAILAVDPERVFKTPEEIAEKAKMDDEFKKIALRDRADSVKEKIEESRRKAIESFEDMTGQKIDKGNLPDLDFDPQRPFPPPFQEYPAACPGCGKELGTTGDDNHPTCDNCDFDALVHEPDGTLHPEETGEVNVHQHDTPEQFTEAMGVPMGAPPMLDYCATCGLDLVNNECPNKDDGKHPAS